ncbi:hypothetical protein BGW42_004815 [Actinomortierella wolfii]|nr:hypothetical protein BGW42_004815 [Actinomortierella wolfii]
MKSLRLLATIDRYDRPVRYNEREATEANLESDRDVSSTPPVSEPAPTLSSRKRIREPCITEEPWHSLIVSLTKLHESSARHTFISLNMRSVLLRNTKNKDRLTTSLYSMVFQKRATDAFWVHRALKTAERMQIVTSATIAKQTGIEIQKAGLQEAISGLKRYPSEL